MLNEVFYQVGLIDAASRGLSTPRREASMTAAAERNVALESAIRFFDDGDVRNMRDHAPRFRRLLSGLNREGPSPETIKG